jgi:membrane-associated phospholipid phosphatase
MVLAIAVPVSRMYIGAYVPLDLIGEAALGITVTSVVNLLLSVRTRAIRGHRW